MITIGPDKEIYKQNWHNVNKQSQIIYILLDDSDKSILETINATIISDDQEFHKRISQ